MIIFWSSRNNANLKFWDFLKHREQLGQFPLSGFFWKLYFYTFFPQLLVHRNIVCTYHVQLEKFGTTKVYMLFHSEVIVTESRILGGPYCVHVGIVKSTVAFIWSSFPRDTAKTTKGRMDSETSSHMDHRTPQVRQHFLRLICISLVLTVHEKYSVNLWLALLKYLGGINLLKFTLQDNAKKNNQLNCRDSSSVSLDKNPFKCLTRYT